MSKRVSNITKKSSGSSASNGLKKRLSRSICNSLPLSSFHHQFLERGGKIAAAGNSHAAIAATEGPEFIVVDSSSPERRTKLRLLIAQRIERIDLVWSPTILGADKLGLPKKPYVFLSRKSARVLKLGRKTML